MSITKEIKVPNKKIFFYALLIAILTIVVFSNSLQNNFVKNFDDIIYTSAANNAKALTTKDIGTIFSSYVAGIYHPITVLSLAIETNLFGESAFHFHLINLMLHIFNVLLLFWFIYIFTKRLEIAVIVALFFGIHPMHVESVAWISERKDVLFTFFFLASLIAYLFYLKNDKNYSYLFYSLVFFLLSLLSKSAAVCLAPLIVLIDYYKERKFNYIIIIEKIPYFILAIIFGIVSMISQSAAGATSALTDFNFHFSFFDKIFLVSYSVMFYIIKLFAPFNLSAIHYYPLKTGGMLPFVYYLALIGIICVIFLIIKFKKIRKDIVFGFLFFFISIVLVLQFIPVGYAIVAERYSYIPYIGLLFIAGKLYCDFTDNKFGNYSKPRRNYIIIFISLFAVLFSCHSYERNKVWKNGITLYDDIIEKNPEVGYCYWARGTGKLDMNDINGALADFNNAIKLNYKYPVAYNSRANCYFEMDSLKQAIADYSEAINIDDEYSMAYYNRGKAKQKFMDYAGSIDDYKKAIEYKVENIASAYNEMSYSQICVSDLQSALESVCKAMELDHAMASTYLINKARIEFLQKNYDVSFVDFNKAIDSNPNDQLAYYFRGLLKINRNDKNGACEDLSKSAELGYAKAKETMKLNCK